MERIKSPINPNAKWKKLFSREYAVQYTEVSLRSLSPEVKDLLPCAFYEQIYIPEENNETCYTDEDKWNNFLECIKKKWNLKNVKAFYNLFVKTGKQYVSFARRASKIKLDKKSNKQLNKLYKTYQRLAVRYTLFIFLAYFLNEAYAEKARNIIQKRLPKNEDVHVYFDISFAPEKKAAILELTDKASSTDKISEKLMKELYNKFKWIPCLDIHNKLWTFEEFKQHIKDFRKKKQKPNMSYKELLRRLKVNAQEKNALDAAKLFAYIKDVRDDFRREGIYYIQSSLFKEIAGRMSFDLRQLSYAQEADINNFLENGIKLPKSRIDERRNGFVIYFDSNKKLSCVSGSNIGIALQKLGLRKEDASNVEMKGMPASTGVSTGKVAIVKGVKDLGNVEKGDVLVAVTTHPDYVPAMQRAIAIVTEEGGVTSHAAIVSREFGIPCVVGTKIATKALQAGDIVEVNGTNGIVKILKKKA